MYCKNCGNAIDPNTTICENCGAPAGQGSNYCSNCGTNISPGSTYCIACGYNVNVSPASSKSKVCAGILGILLGSLGIHNFYLGYNGKGLAQLLITLLSCGTLSVVSEIWGIVEGIMILTGSINTDANGNRLNE